MRTGRVFGIYEVRGAGLGWMEVLVGEERVGAHRSTTVCVCAHVHVIYTVYLTPPPTGELHTFSKPVIQTPPSWLLVVDLGKGP